MIDNFKENSLSHKVQYHKLITIQLPFYLDIVNTLVVVGLIPKLEILKKVVICLSLEICLTQL